MRHRVSSESTLFATHPARCLHTKGEYGKVTDTEIKLLIFSKSVTIIIFVEFINQLIDYPINCASLNRYAFENNVHKDQMLQNAAFDQGLHCLPYIQQYFPHINR